jgi:hypothetical protein
MTASSEELSPGPKRTIGDSVLHLLECLMWTTAAQADEGNWLELDSQTLVL